MKEMSYWIVFLVSMAACSVGFRMYIWFFSVGFGLAISAISAALMIAYHGSLGAAEWIACLLLFFYGLRLSGYLFLRERKSAAYRTVLNPEMERSKKMPMIAKVSIWVSCGFLYTLMTIPLYFRLENHAAPDPALWIGVVIMAAGILLELVADMQKSAAKKKNSRRFVDTGLYGVVRCPNYLGELLLWLGVFITGIPALRGVWQWVLAILGFVLITWVMFSGARRLEIRQDRNYGSDPAYQEYVRTVPIIIPFIPLYSVKKYKFLVA
jgi:steroid 5-alpha reductase family enzyme